MKLLTKSLTPFLSIVFLMIILLSSCKQKGCTDKNALNYNSAADQDDGTCLYCKHLKDTVGTATDSVQDFSSTNNHYMEYVVKYHLVQISDKYNSDQCGQSSCYIKFQITSLINSDTTMDFNYNISSSAFGNYFNTVSIPAGQTIPQTDIIPSSCQNTINQFTPNFNISGQIYYH